MSVIYPYMKIIRSAASKARHTSFLALAVLLFAVSGYFVWQHANRSVLALNTAPTGTSWNMILSEEFNGTSLNLAQWKPYHNTYGDGNLEEACLTPGNVSVGGGTMKLTAKRENVACPRSAVDNFTSGFIDTRGNGLYYPAFARYEIRAKLPHGQGLWPAFWLRHKAGSSTAEVDVMEYFHATRPGQASQTLHFPAEIGSNTTKVHKQFEQPTATPGWHTWAVEIIATDDAKTKAKFVFYQDGIKTHEYTPTKFGWLNNHDKSAMFDIAINLAVGGRYTGHPDDDLAYSRYLQKCLKPYLAAPPCNASNVLRATFPSAYEVDYVRVYTLQSTPVVTSPGTPTPKPKNTSDATNNSKKDSAVNSVDNKEQPAAKQAEPKTESSSVAKGGPESEPTRTGEPRIATKVEYLVDGKVVQTDNEPPFVFNKSILTRSASVTERTYYADGSHSDVISDIPVKESPTAPYWVMGAVVSGVAALGVAGYALVRHRSVRFHGTGTIK